MLVEQSRRLGRTSLAWTLFLGGAGALAASLWWDENIAWGIAAGALIAWGSFMATAQQFAIALDRYREALSGAPESDPDPAPSEDGDPPREASREDRQYRVLNRLKRPLLLLALVWISWYTPARPEGVALGVTIALMATVIAGFTVSGAQSAD